ncbi:DUF378 domain-containing protein [Patescibacteria group bacterium]|nr:DUF378 domain-containing protein [Patescibacteria group bacterium]
MKCKTTTGTIAYWLMFIGALNWGLTGLGYFLGGNWNIVNLIAGQWPTVENIVYLLVGISAITMLISCRKCSCA